MVDLEVGKNQVQPQNQNPIKLLNLLIQNLNPVTQHQNQAMTVAVLAAGIADPQVEDLIQVVVTPEVVEEAANHKFLTS